ncbi:MAG TPA: hypothetical protein VNG35_04130 [Gemmatimonadales bacterium]|nr:hypothetical protein [Gemmatimonadales bacterium]
MVTGKGSVSFAPPLPVERGQLQHALGDSSLTAPLTSIVFFFAEVRVRQEGVPTSFVMPVPLLIKFADSAQVYVRVTSRGPLTEGQLALPRDPVRLELNPLQSVLANVNQEDWRTTP